MKGNDKQKERKERQPNWSARSRFDNNVLIRLLQSEYELRNVVRSEALGLLPAAAGVFVAALDCDGLERAVVFVVCPDCDVDSSHAYVFWFSRVFTS